ncbi:ABC transporter ATP-binding protein [Subtercola sp. YIM 133946]|uniref:ABC transporter ATP-binding protein n=1 Tax=Subtercola sp. YIM 133946 TaxID=3118909 RepID=UPI002F927BC9
MTLLDGNRVIAPTVVELDDITFSYGEDARPAVDGVSMSLAERHSLGIVGESGSGKSTVARIIAGALRPQTGSVTVLGENLLDTGRARSNRVQMIFQNPYAALNPRLTCGEAVAEAARVVLGQSRKQAQATSVDLLHEVGLGSSQASVYPRSLSGGQRQRVVIARALACEPTLLVADEPTSALDVSVQAQIVNLLLRLRVERGLSLVMISHNLAVIGHVSDSVVVMRHGAVVETGTREKIFNSPEADYTRELLASTTFTR